MKYVQWALFAFLAIWLGLFLLDFHLDVKDRDCFTWMDPQQYHGFADEMVRGLRSPSEFDVPSIFPFILAPFVSYDDAVGVSLWVNVFAAVVLFLAVALLSREMSLRITPIWITAVILCSPLLVGLSRSLYLEFTLSAIVAVAFAIYIKMIRHGGMPLKVIFGVVFYLGILTKMTFPLFFMLAAACHFFAYLSGKRWREAMKLVAVFVVPGLCAIGTVWMFFPRGYQQYYASYGNTSIPIMYLVGPLERWTPESITYYFWVLVTMMLGIMAPLLLLSLFLPRWDWRSLDWSRTFSARATLWCWLVGPMVLLIPQVVKEPRHVAPCLVPAILLIVATIESLERRSLRVALFSLVTAISVLQYLAVTSGLRETPYFLDRPLALDGLQRQLAEPEINEPAYLSTPPPLRTDHWRFNQNVVLVGFEPNEALAISWALWPAVVVDLHTYDHAEKMKEMLPDLEYQDLSIVSIFNTLNRRCGWQSYQFPLTKHEVLENADLIFTKSYREIKPDQDRFRLIDEYNLGGQQVDIWKNVNESRIPFRILYGRQYLASHPDLSKKEKNTVAFDMRLTAVLRGQMKTAMDVMKPNKNTVFDAGDPVAELTRSLVPRRKIYFIAGSGNVLHRHVEQNIYRRMLLSPRSDQ